MPLVRIDLLEGRTDDELKTIADTVQQCMREVFAAPEGDRYQVITEHKPGRMFLEDTGLGFTRSAGMMLIQITQQGRDTDQKQSVYALLSERLGEKAGLAPEDLVVSVVESDPQDWSFGFGRAQFLTGEL